MPELIQRSFTSGEISPALQSRADIIKYATGLNLCENFFVKAQGGAYSRPGLKFLGELADSTKQGKLIPFSFSTQQTYMLVFEDSKIRIMKDGGYVLKPAATITNVTQANPAVVTTFATHTFANGESVTITGVVGMTELNGNTYVIANVTATTFELQGIDSTGYGAYTSGGSAQSDGAYEVTTTYLETELPRLDYTQSADVMTITNLNHDPSNLSRLADDNWTLAAINYAPTVTAPVIDPGSIINGTISNITQANPAVVTIAGLSFDNGNLVTLSNVVGMTEVNGQSYNINIISATQFELIGIDSTGYTAYVSGGQALRLNGITTIGAGFSDFKKTYTYVITAVDADGVESLASASASITTLSLSTTAAVKLKWGTVAGAQYYRIYKDPSTNTGIYGWIGDSTTTEFEDFNTAPVTSDAPPEDRQPFTGAGNKPSVVNYYQQRQVFANTSNEPQAVYTTQVNNFNSLRTSNPLRDDDAVTFTISARQVNEIRHLVSLDTLIILTSGGEWVVSEGQDRVLTPSTIGVRIQSYNGSSWVKPAVINSTVLFLQDKGTRVRDLGYEFSSDKYTGNDLSLMSEHLFEGFEIIDMAYSDEPYGILWCVRSDGVLLGLTYQREHQVWGWHRHTTDGEFESVAVISEDGRDAVYVIVKRTINSVVKRYVERFEPRESKIVEDAFCVDSGLSYIGSTAVVTNATQANPVVITTSVAHGYNNGDDIRIENIIGMTELNGIDFVVGNATSTTFELQGIDGTGYTTYVSGGIIKELTLIVTGADHLEGEEVDILADGYVVEGKTVSSGSVTLDRPANKVHLGLPYTPVIELLDIDIASSSETLKADSVSVSKVTLEVEGTRGGFIGARQDINSGQDITFREIKPRFDSDGYDAISLKSYKQEVLIDPIWSKGGGVRIEQRVPLPIAILSVIPKVDVGGN